MKIYNKYAYIFSIKSFYMLTDTNISTVRIFVNILEKSNIVEICSSKNYAKIRISLIFIITNL